MPLRVAAVELLLNVLRPTVAVAVYITLAAQALHTHADCREKVAARDEDYLDWFVEEVRRFYPFFPAVAARVRQDFEWQGYAFRAGDRVLLDLYGTNHDARHWEAPEEFRPERFRHWPGDAFGFIPQGGGDAAVHHRCPGEAIAVELTKAAIVFLVRKLRDEVPEQDLQIDWTRLPARPRSQFIFTTATPA